MKSLKHIFGLLMMTAMIIAAGCNKEENGGKKENYPHPNSTYKACPILAHWKNEQLGIKEINIKYTGGEECILRYDKEQRVIDYYGYEYINDINGRLIKVKNSKEEFIISYDNYGFIDSVYIYEDGNDIIYRCFTFIYSIDTVFIKDEREDEGKWVEDKCIMKFSDDLYLTYKASIDNEWWEKYNWQNGNLISMYDNEGRKENYQHDNSPNIYIYRLTDTYFFNRLGLIAYPYTCSKNNPIEEDKTYTYNEKGLLEIISLKDENGVEKVKKSFSYIYY